MPYRARFDMGAILLLSHSQTPQLLMGVEFGADTFEHLVIVRWKLTSEWSLGVFGVQSMVSWLA